MTLTLNLPPELEAAIARHSKRREESPEAFVLEVLTNRLLPGPLVPRDEWERKLANIGVDCGVVLPDEAMSREALYE